MITDHKLKKDMIVNSQNVHDNFISEDRKLLEILDWGVLGYEQALYRQRRLVDARVSGESLDCLILVEHTPTVTLGRRSGPQDLRIGEEEICSRGVKIYKVERGGMATYHGPGQLVAYPIIELKDEDIPRYINMLQNITAKVLRSYGLNPVFKENNKGVWVGPCKIASIGVAMRNKVVYHGLALNVRTNLEPFNWIVPCGHSGEQFTTMEIETGVSINITEIKNLFIEEFCKQFGFIAYSTFPQRRHPSWILQTLEHGVGIENMEAILSKYRLNTVCQSAQCPNVSHCFQKGTATFMILGTQCTRKCMFCAIESGLPANIDYTEPRRVAQAAKILGLRHVVVTSVTRDDLQDGGAEHFVRTIEEIRKYCPNVSVEVLIPDFKGNCDALDLICEARPEMLNHNIETVLRLYPLVRPQADFDRSMNILRYAAEKGLCVKSGLMLGLGETEKEIEETLIAIKHTGCRYLTIGQYLAPSRNHFSVRRYLPPEEFNEWGKRAREIGFDRVRAGPFIRSSYEAMEMINK